MTDNSPKEYQERLPQLVRTAERLEAHIRVLLKDTAHIDRISARAKDPVRFAAKAAKTTAAGKQKYVDPLLQIQDQIGARVVVFYKQDVDAVGAELERYFRSVERKDLVPESDW